jgi:hypothetical protein
MGWNDFDTGSHDGTVFPAPKPKTKLCSGNGMGVAHSKPKVP